jgi:DNA polymerase sigma
MFNTKSRPQVVDASHQADVVIAAHRPSASLSPQTFAADDYYVDHNGTTHHSMSTETHRSTACGTDSTLNLREQGTSTTDLPPWSPSRRDQSTSTESTTTIADGTDGADNDHNNPWRRMVMAATAAARERARMEHGGIIDTTNSSTTTGNIGIRDGGGRVGRQGRVASSGGATHSTSYYNQSRGNHHSLPKQQSYDSGVQERERDYSVIKDTCLELSLELRSFGAYTQQVDVQCRPTIEVFVKCLQDAIQMVCPNCTVVPYGSYATGLWLPTSDVDMVVQGAGSKKRLNRKQKKKKKKKTQQKTEKSKKNEKSKKTEKNWSERVSGIRSTHDKEENADVEEEEEEEEQEVDVDVEEAEGADMGEGEQTPKELLEAAWEAYQLIYNYLLCQPWAENVIAVRTSRMPVIKLTLFDGRNQIPFDVTIDPGLRRDVPDVGLAIHSGVPVLQLVQYCLSKMKGLATLTLVVKQFLRERGLNDTFRGGASSYTLFLMLVKHLQPHYPPLFEGEEFDKIADRELWASMIRKGRSAMSGDGGAVKSTVTTNEIPSSSSASSHNTTAGDSDRNNTMSSSKTTSSSTSAPLHPNAPAFTAAKNWRQLTSKLMKPLARAHQQFVPGTNIGAMLMEFLFYYGDIFDYSRDGFSIIDDRKEFNVLQERYGGDPQARALAGEAMWIDDPMRPGSNVAGSTFQIQQIASVFRDGFLSLGRHRDDHDHPTRLSRLIKSSPWIEKFRLDASTREEFRIQELQLKNKKTAQNAAALALPLYSGKGRRSRRRKEVRVKKMKKEKKNAKRDTSNFISAISTNDTTSNVSTRSSTGVNVSATTSPKNMNTRKNSIKNAKLKKKKRNNKSKKISTGSGSSNNNSNNNSDSNSNNKRGSNKRGTGSKQQNKRNGKGKRTTEMARSKADQKQ